ncbi:hypothetical protein [Haemophilus haemolyticus]|uniref:hypothetical protein n=1 Tax=Haemophilus haemolyticus TaxID=726 RepID=UPI000E0D66C9|nr:hypothetical protein [Haemophilus haemolyticus]
MSKRKGQLKSSGRGIENRIPKSLINKSPKYISVSFLYFQNIDDYPAQSLENWDDEGRLLDMLKTLQHVTSNDITQLQSSDEKIKLYHDFPPKSVNEFSIPPSLKGCMEDSDKWGVLRNVGGQKPRIVGFLRGEVFYIVYLDKEHKFYKSEKK